MPRTNQLRFSIRADASDANRKLDTTSRKVDNLGKSQGTQARNSRKSAEANVRTQKSLVGLGNASAGARKAMGALAAGGSLVVAALASVGAAVISSIRSFAELETALSEVATLFDGTPEQLERIAASIQGVTVTYGTDQIENARAYYQIVSSGAEAGAEANKLLEESVRLAIAGVTDVSVAADAITTLINAYGLSSDRARSISDKLFQTVRSGKTTMEELGSSLGQVVSTSAAAGLSIDELLGALATLTLNGVSTSEAVTQLRSLLSSIFNPTASAAAQAKLLGVEWNKSGLEAHGLVGLLDQLIDATDGNITQAAKLITTTEGLAVFAVAEKDIEAFGETIKDVGDSAGSTAEAVAKMSDTIGFESSRLVGTLGAISTSAGKAAAETIGLTGLIRDITDVTALWGNSLGLLSDESLTVGQRLIALTTLTSSLDAEQDKNSETSVKLRERIKELQGSFQNLDLEFIRQETARLDAEEAQLNETLEEGTAAYDGKLKSIETQRRGLGFLLGAIFDQIDAENDLNEATKDTVENTDEQTKANTALNEKINAGKDLIEKYTGGVDESAVATETYKIAVDQLAAVYDKFPELAGQVFATMAELRKELGLDKEAVEELAESTNTLNSHTDRILESVDPVLKINNDYARSIRKIDEDVKNKIKTDAEAERAKEIERSKRDGDLQALKDERAETKLLADEGDELLKTYQRLLVSTEPLSEAAQTYIDRVMELQVELDAGRIKQKEFNEEVAEAEGVFLRAATGAKTFGETLGEALGNVEDSFAGFFDVGGGGENLIYNALVGDEEALKRQFADLGGQAGAAFGMAWGPIGSAIGRALGEAIGDAFGETLAQFTTDNDRVTVGVSAFQDPFSQLGAGDTVTSASGLQLTPQARGAGAAGAATANDLLESLLGIDQRLVDLFAQLGIIIDLSGTNLRTGRQTDAVRASGQHDPFGSVELGRVDQDDLDNAANEFTLAFINAVIDQLPEDIAGLLAEATNMEDVFRILGDAINPLLNGLSDSAQALYDQAFPLVKVQENNVQVLKDLRDARNAGIITEEEYATLVELQGNIFSDARRKIAEANGVIFQVSGATQSLLDQLYPLEALERTRTATIERLDAELKAGVITATQHARAVSATNKAFDEGAEAVAKARGEVLELTSAHQNLIDELDPLGALERERQKDLRLLRELYQAGEISIEQYQRGVNNANRAFQDGVRDYENADRVLTELSQTTKDALDQLRPLEKLERDRTSRLAELRQEYENGDLSLEDYNRLLGQTHDAYREGALELKRNSDEYKAFVQTNTDALREQYDERVAGLNAEAEAVRASISLIDQEIVALDLASVTINEFIRGWNLFEQAWDLSEFGSDVRTLNGRFEVATQRVRDLASAGTFTAASAAELASAMEIQRRTALELAVAWLNLTSVLESTLGGLARRLDESLLTADELVALRSQEITDLRRQLDVATTPEEVARIVNDIARSIQDVVDSYEVRQTTGADGQEQFATTAFGQEFTADSAEALRALVVGFAAELARAIQGEGEAVADRGQVDQALDDEKLRDEIADLPEKLREAENELIDRRESLVDREEDIADQFEQATQDFEDAVQTFKDTADRMDFTAERNEATEKRMASSINKFELVATRQEEAVNTISGAANTMETASSNQLTASSRPIQVQVSATFREVNA